MIVISNTLSDQSVELTSKMLQQADQYPLFLGDPQALLNKLETATGPLQNLWQGYQTMLHDDPDARQKMLPFWAALSGNDMTEAKDQLREKWTQLLDSDHGHGLQKHTWCACGARMRQAIFVDWLHHRQPFSQDELQQAAEAYLGVAFKYAYPTLASRVPSADNQNLSMTLYCTVIGYLFGHKLTGHATGRFLFAYGLQRLPRLIGLFPRDGYAGEGSTYTSQVNTPLFCWLHQLFQTFNLPVNPKGFEPNGTTFKQLIDIERKLIGPTGQMLPWDHYGWSQARNGAPLAYLAGLEKQVDQRDRLLGMIHRLDLGLNPGMMAWGNDNPMWTLIWWPASMNHWKDTQTPLALTGWCLPRTGAALEDASRRTRLVQVWDRCAESFTAVGRMQVNPNHLILEVDGEPVFQDGIPLSGEDPFGFDPQQAMSTLSDDARRRLANYATPGTDRNLTRFVQSQSCGMLGAANAIVVDDIKAYWPGKSVEGKALWYGSGDALQAVCAEVSEFYRPAFDLTQAQRTSIWNARYGIGLVIDELAAQTSHHWTWQAYLRPSASLCANTAVSMNLPNDRHVMLAWETVGHVQLQDVPGFPRTQEAASKRLALSSVGPMATFVTAIGVDINDLRVSRRDTHRWVIYAGSHVHHIELNPQTNKCFWSSNDGSMDELNLQVFNELHQDQTTLPQWDMDDRLAPIDFVQHETHAPTSSAWLDSVDTCLLPLINTMNEQLDDAGLTAMLRSEHWPVVYAAVERIGRLKLGEYAPILRQLLNEEEQIPLDELYAEDQDGSCIGSDKRWRLKVALIVALGRLKDSQAAPMIAQILDRSLDFYTVHSVAALALSRIGCQTAQASLQRAAADPEVNTSIRAREGIMELCRGV